MRNAFLIIAHTNFDQVIQMMQSLDSMNSDFFIHINKTVMDFSQEKFCTNIHQSKVVFVNRHEIFWGGAGILIASLELIKTALNTGHYDYFHLLTGADLPIKRKSSLDFFLEQNLFMNKNGQLKTNYISANPNILPKTRARVEQFNIGVEHWQDVCVFKREFWKKLNRVLYYGQTVLKIDRLKKCNMQLAYGSPWWSISDEFASFVTENEDFLKTQFAKKWMFGADEFAIQTLFYNSQYADTAYLPERGYSANLREIDFERGNGLGSPYIWRSYDFEQLMRTNNFFGRKFNQQVDQEIVKRVLEFIKGRK